jgi:uronate dehydrogenase
MTPPFNRILLTGAAGRLGSRLRAGVRPLATTLRPSDRVDLGPLQPREEAAIFDLSDMEATLRARQPSSDRERHHLFRH